MIDRDRAIEFFQDVCEVYDDPDSSNPKAVIAGGYVRDFVYNFAPRDVDVYVQHDINKPERNLKEIAKKWGLTECKTSAYSKINGILDLYENQEKDIQVIVTTRNPLIFIKNTFDYAVCQAALDSQCNLYTSQYFENDLYKSDLTLLLQEHFPNWQIGKCLTTRRKKMESKFNRKTNILFPEEILQPLLELKLRRTL